MPLPRSIARFNSRVTNPVLVKVAGHLPTFGILHHVGRKSGRLYKIPINVFKTSGGYIIALTYGPETDWVKNVLAAGECELETRGKKVQLNDPRIHTDPSISWAPLALRPMLKAANITQHMRLSLKD